MRRWPAINSEPGRGRLGGNRALEFWTHAIDSYPLPVKVWIVDDRVELVELLYPSLDPEAVARLLDRLGPPQDRRDYRLDVARFAGRAHVHPERGLTVFLDHSGTGVNRVWLYPACPLDEYDDRFEHERELHERPHDAWTEEV